MYKLKKFFRNPLRKGKTPVVTSKSSSNATPILHELDISIQSGLIITSISENSIHGTTSSKKKRVIAHATTTLELLKAVSEVNNCLAPMKVICGALLHILKTIEEMNENKKAWKGLLRTIQRHYIIFEQQLSHNVTLGLDPRLQAPIQAYAQTLRIILAVVVRESGVPEESGSADTKIQKLVKFVKDYGTSKLETAVISDYVKQLDDALKELLMSTGLRTAITVDRIHNITEGIETTLASLGSVLRTTIGVGSLHQTTWRFGYRILLFIFIIIGCIFWGMGKDISSSLGKGIQPNSNSGSKTIPTIMPTDLPITSPILLKPRPSVVESFFGRKEILEAMRQTHFNQRNSSHRPAMTVLSGLGGSGKTQTALKFALEFEERFPDNSIYFLDASSEEKLRVALETLVPLSKKEDNPSSYEDSLAYLATKEMNWLLILDNADDPSLRISPYIPKCDHGNVIVTTRNSNHITLAPNGYHHLEGLSTDDAAKLILTSSAYEKTTDNLAAAEKIAATLGNLPLALAQAGGYILIHKCLTSYLNLYNDSEGKLLADMPGELASGYPVPVATTIQMSLDQLSQRAQDVLRIFSHLDSTSISPNMIQKAARSHFEGVFMTDSLAVNPLTLQHAEALQAVFSPHGEWSEFEFNQIITQCLRYSLLRLTTQNMDSQAVTFYSMHILVKSYLQARRDLVQGFQPGPLVVRLLGSTYTDDELHFYDDSLVSHLKAVQMGDIIEAGDHCAFGRAIDRFYDEMGIACWEKCTEMWQASLGTEHRNTVWAMENLFHSCKNAGSNIQRTMEMKEQVLRLQEKALEQDHDEIIWTMEDLINSYDRVGRGRESIELTEKLLKLQLEVLGPEHPNTQLTICVLGAAYWSDAGGDKIFEMERVALKFNRRGLGFQRGDIPYIKRILSGCLVPSRVLDAWYPACTCARTTGMMVFFDWKRQGYHRGILKPAGLLAGTNRA